MFPSSSSASNRFRRINRPLDTPHDIYLAQYDVATQLPVPIPNPRCGNIRTFLPLPYKNPKRYAKIFRVLTRIANSTDLTFANLTQGIQSYIDYGQIDFSALRHLISQMSDTQKRQNNETLRFIASLALELNEENFEKIPLLTTGSNSSITMSQRQAAILLANGFFCTFEDSIRYYSGSYNTFNFIQLFSSETFKSEEKLKCIFSYFQSIQRKVPTGMITILRQSCPHIRFEEICPPFCQIHLDVDNFIEDQNDEAHVDFANEFIGGGVLGHGVVQEEIRFTVAPEALISCLLCEKMSKNEAILLVGTQQYVDYDGYAETFKFVAPKIMEDQTERTPLGHYPSCIIAIDAICYSRSDRQFVRGAIDREIRKAFVGFSVKIPFESQVIATGNWGCGAFNGNLELKFLIQLIAASSVGRNLHYFTFGDDNLMRKVEYFMGKLKEKKVTFDKLYSRLISGGPRPVPQLIASPFNFILKMIDCQLPDYLMGHLSMEQWLSGNQENPTTTSMAEVQPYQGNCDMNAMLDEMEAIQSQIANEPSLPLRIFPMSSTFKLTRTPNPLNPPTSQQNEFLSDDEEKRGKQFDAKNQEKLASINAKMIEEIEHPKILDEEMGHMEIDSPKNLDTEMEHMEFEDFADKEHPFGHFHGKSDGKSGEKSDKIDGKSDKIIGKGGKLALVKKNQVNGREKVDEVTLVNENPGNSGNLVVTLDSSTEELNKASEKKKSAENKEKRQTTMFDFFLRK